MLKKAIFVIFLLNISLHYSQSNQVYKGYYRGFLKAQFSDPNIAKKYLDSILKIPSLTDSLVSKTFNDYGINQAVVGNYPNAIKYFNKALNYDKKCSKITKANILCNLANTQKLFGKFDLALNNLFSAKKIYVLLNDKKNILKVTSELSSVYYNKSDYNKALDISSELIPELEKLGDEKLLSIQYLRMANIQFNIGDYYNSISNYQKTLPYFSKKIENNTQNKYVALMNIGECYSELGSAKALIFFNKAVSGFRTILDKRNEYICSSRIGKYYYKNQNYEKALPYLKNSFEYMYANLPHLSLETFTFYIKNLQKQNRYNEIRQLILLDVTIMTTEANIEEKVFYYETMAKVYEKFENKSKEFSTLKVLQVLYQEREKQDTFEELQKKLNQYNIKSEISKNKNLELKLSNLKLQNTIVLILILFLILGVLFFLDKFKKKNKIQKLILLQLEQEKELHKKSNNFKDIQIKLESEVIKVKERELTALQLKVYQIKSKVIGFLESNENKLDAKEIQRLISKIESCFENEDYWKEFQLRFTNMHPNFMIEIKRLYPKLTRKDIDFLTLIKLNLTNKEIATLINISYESVISKKYLLRKKMNLISDNELVDCVHKF